jgi:simple sugar transport system substrate-binding protein
MTGSRRSVLVVALVLIAAIALVGCGGGAPKAKGSADQPSVAAKPLKLLLISHSPSTEQFWIPIDKGLQQAAKELGVTAEYRGVQANLQDPNEERKLILNAIAAKPDGLIISNPYPDSLNPVIKQAVDAGIPVVLINAGGSEVLEVGALTYVGNDEVASGRLAARKLGDVGCKHALLITTPPGALAFVDDRNKGFIDGFPGKVTRADIPLSNINDSTRIKTIIETELHKNPSIDCAFSIGSAASPGMLAARADLGERANAMHWAAMDLVASVVDAIKSKQMDFAIDQQQFGQGYLPVVVLSMYLRYGISPGSELIGSGPGLVTLENVDRILELQKQNYR